MHLLIPPSAFAGGTFSGEGFPVTEAPAPEDIEIADLERLLRALLGNDVSDSRMVDPDTVFVGKSWKLSSTNCESHSSSTASSFGMQRPTVKLVEEANG